MTKLALEVTPEIFEEIIPKLQTAMRDVMDPHGAATALAMVGVFQQQFVKNELLREASASQARGLENAEQHTKLLRDAMSGAIIAGRCADCKFWRIAETEGADNACLRPNHGGAKFSSGLVCTKADFGCLQFEQLKNSGG